MQVEKINDSITLYNTDSRDLNFIPNESVHLSISSPPYFVDKDYDLSSFDKFLELLKTVYQEQARIIVPGGKICINIGDIASFSRVSGHVQEKMIMPYIVDYLESVGVYLFARIIWQKDVPWVNSPFVTYHEKTRHTEYRVPPSWEYVFVFRKGTEPRNDLSMERQRTEKIPLGLWKDWITGIWDIRSVRSNNEHSAMYPPELPYRLIKMFSFVGDTVIDPFLGSGTTAYVAARYGRKAIGSELDEKYFNIAKKNCVRPPNHVMNLLESLDEKEDTLAQEYRAKVRQKTKFRKNAIL